ncbi:MAG: hypothetical protein KatS3mg121_0189 [Gammaproteobacteria bacterium]|nr:MAG: hypothetical protein KatS3mg121_0189 [Gammaproteobacteria bacterium]
MSEPRYDIVFEGRLSGRLPLDQVKRNLAALFKMNTTQVEALFRGQAVVIKRGVDAATAERFKAAFDKAGAVCLARPSGPPPQPAAAPPAEPPPRSAPPARPAPGGGRATGRMAGKDLVDLPVPDQAALAGLSLGAPGETLPSLDSGPPPPPPDTAGLSLAEDDAPLEPPRQVQAPPVDLSGLALEEEEPEPPRPGGESQNDGAP